MINVLFSEHKGSIKKIEISGHALSAPKGSDLVCAGVSSISVGILNTIDTILPNTCEMKMSEALINIRVKKDSEQLQTILKTLWIQLLTIETDYGKYIKLKKQEV